MPWKFAIVLVLAGCGSSSSEAPIDLRGVYHLTISHESGAPGAQWIADYLANALSGSPYLRVRRIPSHGPMPPKQHGNAWVHVSTDLRLEQNLFQGNRRRGSAMCGLGELDCGGTYRSATFDAATVWGTLEITILRAGFSAQKRSIVDHIARGPRQLLYERLAVRAAGLL